MTLGIITPFHEPSVGLSDDWYTPPIDLKLINLTFDLDPCSPGPHHWVPARKVYTIDDDGLVQPWSGLVFMNPPFGPRNGIIPWLKKFFDHGNGFAVVRSYTSCGWFHQHVVPRAELLCFPRGKTKFVRPDGSIGKAPGHGVVYVGMGSISCEALRHSGLGFCARILP